GGGGRVGGGGGSGGVGGWGRVDGGRCWGASPGGLRDGWPHPPPAAAVLPRRRGRLTVNRCGAAAHFGAFAAARRSCSKAPQIVMPFAPPVTSRRPSGLKATL